MLLKINSKTVTVHQQDIPKQCAILRLVSASLIYLKLINGKKILSLYKKDANVAGEIPIIIDSTCALLLKTCSH